MFRSNSKKVGLPCAVFCLIFVFLFFFVVGASPSFACSKTCKAKGSSQACAGHSQATSENSGESSGQSQSVSTSQPAEKQAMSCGRHGSVPMAPSPAKLTVKEKYTCPMHPEVIKGKPGKCPKCGMNLEKKEFYEVYACPMKDCPYFSEKGGKCPTCGMKLKKKLVSKEEYEKLTQTE